MKLQTKISLGLLPLILLSFSALGFWSISTTSDGIRETQLDHLTVSIDTFFEEELERAVTILDKNNLNTVLSFVHDYQKTIKENAKKKFIGKKQHLLIFDESGDLIFCSSSPTQADDYKKPLIPYVTKIKKNPEATVHGHMESDGNHFNFIGRYFPAWGWHVFLTTSDEQVHDSISKLKKATFGVAALFALSCFLFIILLFRFFFVQPIKQLKETSQKIANRQRIKSFGAPRNDELGDLAQSLEVMSKDIYAYQDSLISGKKYLEQEVHKQTHELAKEKQLAQEYLDVAGVMLVALDNIGRITMINQKSCHLLEVREEDVIGKKWIDNFLPKEMIEEVTGVFNKLMAGELELVENYENPAVTSQGEVLTIAFHNTVLKNNRGEISGILFSGEDITSRKQMEEALQESEERFRLMMHQSPSVIELYDMNGLQIEVNQAYETLWGFPASQSVNKFNVLKSKEVEDSGLKTYVKRAYAGESVTVPVYKFDSRGETEAQGAGRERWLKTLIYPVKDSKGNVKNIVVNHEDVSQVMYAEEEKQKLELRLKQAQKMEAIGTLAGGIAHDFNNILTAIFGYAEMIKDDAPPGSQLADDIGKILTSAQRAKELVSQILAFSRQSESERVPLKIQSLVKEALKMLRSSIPTMISIVEKIDAESGTVLADPVQIHQIVVNLCTNAYHAMEETGGTLFVSVENVDISDDRQSQILHLQPGKYVKLTVTDDGKGIGPDVIDKIFDPYFTTKEVGKGTGMGLAIVHGIITDYGGEVVVESRLGSGTTFQVYLPVTEKDALAEGKKMETVPSGKKERILFVDDEEILAQMARTMLERLHYQVTVRGSSLEALATFENTPDAFDLVITDQTMPGMTGIDMSRRMLQIRPDIPIILCTGYSNLVNEEVARKQGIREFALKPLTKANVAELIRKVLDKK
jgi:PAS domain S-box-containing protein